MGLWKNCGKTGENMVNNPLSTANYSNLGAGIPCKRRRISGCRLSPPKIMPLFLAEAINRWRHILYSQARVGIAESDHF